ncbi:MAG: hypothetical protein HWN79_10215 [Candidatus Lokiarchaeota archaeon]|nr:hypothetical protein [Candidatus Lokiarchaeota archaeon]
MGESEWKHAGWVSSLGKWAWIILFVLGIIHIIVGLATAIPLIVAWENARAAWVLAFPGTPFPTPMPIGNLIWNIIGAVISIVVALFIIRPKFSKPCGEKDWEALYGWTLKLGGAKVPWMFIWGIVYAIFGWYSWPAIFVLLPAIMLIFAGPRKYEWK